MSQNAGLTSKDALDRRQDKVDSEAGIVRRRRCKAEYVESAPVVYHELWASTLELLKKHKSKKEQVIEVSFDQKEELCEARKRVFVL